MHHSTEAKQQIQRSRESLALHPNLALEEQTHQLEAEWMYLERAYADCKRAATRNLARANTRKHIETISNSSSLLSKVLRLTGKRRDAERHARVALSGCLEAGDLAAIADVRLDLATLLVERGDAIGATNQFQLANRLVQNLSSPQALTKAIHVELAIATVMGQQVKGGSAISLLSRRSGLPMEAPATMIKWWRSQDKVEQALIVQAPDQTHSWGHILWHLERARLGVQTKDRSLLERELNSISSLEALTQFDELRLYVDLLRQVFSTEVSETDRKRVMKRASRSLNIDLYLGALEFNAVHLQCQERHEAAHTQWATLLARAQELGHSPSIRRAQEYGTNRPKRPENAQTGR